MMIYCLLSIWREGSCYSRIGGHLTILFARWLLKLRISNLLANCKHCTTAILYPKYILHKCSIYVNGSISKYLFFIYSSVFQMLLVNQTQFRHAVSKKLVTYVLMHKLRLFAKLTFVHGSSLLFKVIALQGGLFAQSLVTSGGTALQCYWNV